MTIPVTLTPEHNRELYDQVQETAQENQNKTMLAGLCEIHEPNLVNKQS